MDAIRNGNFTSSQVVKLMSNGKAKGEIGAPAKTYIKHTNWERGLGRSIQKEANTRPLTWGSFCERRVNDLLGVAYKFQGQDTIGHPTIDYWKGSPDAFKFDGEKVILTEIKCPITLGSFCELVDPIYKGLEGSEAMSIIRESHKDGDKYYWQMVSNAILAELKLGVDIDFCELVVYVPYQSELESIKNEVANMDDVKQYRYKWIAFADEDELPYLVDGGKYKNLNKILIQIPQADKDAATERIKFCGQFLEPWPTLKS